MKKMTFLISALFMSLDAARPWTTPILSKAMSIRTNLSMCRAAKSSLMKLQTIR